MNLWCILSFMLFLARASAHVNTQKEFGDLVEDNIDEYEFEEDFGLKPADDPIEEGRRIKALKRNENRIKVENEDFVEGKKNWYSDLNDFDNLPVDEFVDEKTGMKQDEYGRGFLHVTGPEAYDEESEKYFDTFRYSREAIPDEYSSVDEGYTTPVRHQKICGSCVAFSNMAVIETCFKKLTGDDGDYSEQQLIDCGWSKNGANACHGASPWAYIKTIADEKWKLTHESNYVYRNYRPTYKCPPDLKPYNRGARINKGWFTQKGNETLLKQMVYKHGAVTTGVVSRYGFKRYKGGIFSGCRYRKEDHAVTVVGYGRDKGEDYWLIKNSWGTGWGEKGYIRLRRGYTMCGVGKTIVTADCERVPGPMDDPLETYVPCIDKYRKCPTYAKTNCAKYGEKCRKSCGLCKGMTPHVTNKCPDQWKACPNFAKRLCGKPVYGKGCCLSCGLGQGMTPVPSNTCFDFFTNCHEKKEQYCSSKYADKCKLTCDKC